jgi:chemotaxis protein MotB
LERWRASATKEYQKLQAQVASLSQRNQTLETQIANARKHAKLQDQHLSEISRRLKQSASELAQHKSRGQQEQSNFASLDRVNQDKERQLAAARREVQQLEAERSRAARELEITRQKLAAALKEKAVAEKTSETLLASSRRRRNATITPNTNITPQDFVIPGVQVRRDGEVLRIPLATDELFETGTAQLSSSSADRLRRIAYEVSRAFPNQRIGIEGHTDGGTTITAPWRDHHHYSSAQAMAVYEFLSRQGLFGDNQLHVAGHGSNHPVYSSATPDGRRGNCRVELVIYPETV